MTDGKRMLRIRDVALELDLSASTVKKEIALGRLTALRFGRKTIRILREDLAAYLEAKRGGAA